MYNHQKGLLNLPARINVGNPGDMQFARAHERASKCGGLTMVFTPNQRKTSLRFLDF